MFKDIKKVKNGERGEGGGLQGKVKNACEAAGGSYSRILYVFT